MTTSSAPARQSLLIDGQWSGAADGRTYVKIDPFTEEPTTEAAAASVDDATKAVDAAAAATADWAATSPQERAQYLAAAADILDSRAAQVAELMVQECGATVGWGMFNTMLAAGMLRHAASVTSRVDAETEIESHVPGLAARAIRQPAGVVVGIAPWNAPVILGTRAVATPLAFGNTVVLKASEECPRVHGAVAEAISDAGVPDGVINFITNAPEDAAAVVEALITHPATARINFTGSSKIGALIAQQASAHLKRVLLELGGKAPFVVLADADLDEAAAAANFGAFMNSGQICMSTERVIVDAEIAEAFTQKLVDRANALTVGDPRDPGTMVGPVISRPAAERLAELIDDAVGKGAKVLAGGGINGLLVSPTVLDGVTPAMRLYSEESFGPVVTVTTVTSADEAVRIANDSEYGLSASVFGTDSEAAEAVARRIQSGICHINGATVHDEPQMPFGGVKASGWGRFGGDAALDEFTDLRWLTVQAGSRAYPI
jgi:vanillin dehydrogenase